MTIYRLDEYKINESDSGELSWETHFGLGALQEGKCFKKGSILFIGPAENRRDGFLKLEFMAHLQEFPNWLKTKYYCRGFGIYHCKTGKRITKEEMQLWKFENRINKESRSYSAKPLRDTPNGRAGADVSYKLQRYEITNKLNNEIVWKTHAGRSNFNGGIGTVLEDILFIGSGKDIQIPLDKRQFLENLEKLPEWNQTKYYCTKLSLHDCKPGSRIGEERKGWTGKRRTTEKKGTRKRDKKGSAFKSIKSDLSEKTAVLFGPRAKKWLSHIVEWILLTIPLLIAFLIRLAKKLTKKQRGGN